MRRRTIATTACLLFLLALPALLPAQEIGEYPELRQAITAMARGSAKSKQRLRNEALVFKHIAWINKMRVADLITDAEYQACQAFYADKNFEIASAAARRQGVTLVRQQRDRWTPYDAGTDSDYIGDLKSVEQFGAVRDGYNRGVQEYLGKSGVDVPQGEDWALKNDVDFMADPDRIPEGTFRNISAENNDAYFNPNSARREKKVRDNSESSLRELLDYTDDMRLKVDKRTGQIKEVAAKLQEAVRHPAARQEGSEAWWKVKNLEAELQIRQAQKSKYFERWQQTNQDLARKAGFDAPDGSDLPGRGRYRAPQEGVASQRNLTASADAVSGHLKSQTAMNEALILARLGAIGSSDPEHVKMIEERIQKLTGDLSVGQRGEFIERLKQSAHVDDAFVRAINQRMKNAPPTEAAPATGGRVSKLGLVGSGAGLIGDYMGVEERLKQAEDGSHTFINIEEDDSEAVKWMKRAGVAGLELYNVPVIDAMERGWQVNEEEQAYILEQIRKGKAVSEVGSMARVGTKVVFLTVGSMLVEPLLQGVRAVAEGKQTADDLWQNWKTDGLRHIDTDLRHGKLEAIVARVQKMPIGPVIARRGGFEGPLLAGDLGNDEVAAFEIERNEAWTADYKVCWDVIGPARKVVISTGGILASDSRANRLLVGCGRLKPGRHKAVCRVFDPKTGKQMDFSGKAFTISSAIGCSRIIARRGDFKGPLLKRGLAVGERAAFEVGRSGQWDKTHRIEWWAGGHLRKRKSADEPTAHRAQFSIDQLGRCVVSIRAVCLETGKIAAHEKLAIKVKQPAVNLAEELTKTRFRYEYAPTRIPENYRGVARKSGILLEGPVGAEAIPLGAKFFCKLENTVPLQKSIDAMIHARVLPYPDGCRVVERVMLGSETDLGPLADMYRRSSPNGCPHLQFISDGRCLLLDQGLLPVHGQAHVVPVPIPTEVLRPAKVSVFVQRALCTPGGRRIPSADVQASYERSDFRIVEREPDALLYPGDAAADGSRTVHVIPADWVVPPCRVHLASEQARVGDAKLLSKAGEPVATKLFLDEGGARKATVVVTLVDALGRRGGTKGEVLLKPAVQKADLAFRLQVRTKSRVMCYRDNDLAERTFPGITQSGTHSADHVADGARLPVCYKSLILDAHFAKVPRRDTTRLSCRVIGPGGKEYVTRVTEVFASFEDCDLFILFANDGNHPWPGGAYRIDVFHSSRQADVYAKQTFRFSLYGASLRREDEPLNGVYRAIRAGQEQRVLELLSAGAYLGPQKGAVNVYNAVKLGHTAALRALLANGADPNGFVDSGGNTPLMYAAARGDLVATQALLNAKSLVNRRNKKRMTPLHYAVITKHKRLAELLLKHGADQTLKDDKSHIAGYYAYWVMKDVPFAVRLGYREAREYEEKKNRPDVGEEIGEFLKAFSQGLNAAGAALAQQQPRVISRPARKPSKSEIGQSFKIEPVWTIGSRKSSTSTGRARPSRSDKTFYVYKQTISGPHGSEAYYHIESKPKTRTFARTADGKYTSSWSIQGTTKDYKEAIQIQNSRINRDWGNRSRWEAHNRQARRRRPQLYFK